MSSPHDALFKLTFAEPEHAASLLRSVLPPSLARRVDWGALEAVPISFVDEELAERHADLLFATRINGRSAMIYFLFEHQSSVDPWMPLRLLDYCVRAWNHWRRQHADDKRLRAIVPVVLHHSQAGWTASTRFSDLMDLDDAVRSDLAPYLVEFSFLLDDLTRQSDQQLHERVLTRVAEVAVMALKHLPYAEDPIAVMDRILPLLLDVMGAPSGSTAFAALLRYALRVTDVEAEDLRRVVTHHLGQAAGDTVMSTEDRLIERGRKEGEARGRQEGETRGLASALLKQLQLKFGPVPDDVVARVRSAPNEDLERWIERILDAGSIDDTLR